MNERIKLLAEQAGMNPNEPVMDYDRKETHWNGWSTAMEKFAELIVRECAMFVVVELEGQVGSLIADRTANRLEEHFGVTV